MIPVVVYVQLLAGVFSGAGALMSHQISRGSKNQFAIVTLIDGTSDFAGMQVLGCSLLDLAASQGIDLVALCYNLDTASRQLAKDSGWTCTDAEHINNPNPEGTWPQDYTMKIAPFAMTQYSRVLVMDSDMIVANRKDFMQLFTRPLQEGHIMASRDCFSPLYWKPGSGPDAFSQVQAGAIVLKPSWQMYEDLKAAAPTTYSLDGGGQGFVSEFFKGRVQWLEAKFDYVRSASCVGLMNGTGFYDLDGDENHIEHDIKTTDTARRVSREDAEKKARRDLDNGGVVIVHYQGQPKPWKCQENHLDGCGRIEAWSMRERIDALNEAWWAIANACKLSHPDR